MSLDCRVRESIQEEAKGIVAPPELKEKVIVQIKMNQGGVRGRNALSQEYLQRLFNPDDWFCVSIYYGRWYIRIFENLKACWNDDIRGVHAF